jgi:hypothetical protein
VVRDSSEYVQDMRPVLGSSGFPSGSYGIGHIGIDGEGQPRRSKNRLTPYDVLTTGTAVRLAP